MLPDWFKKPEVVYTTVLFLIGIAVSLYPSIFRKGLGLPGKAMRRSLLSLSENELRLLEWLNGNAYALVLWLAWSLVDLLNYLFLLLLLSGFIDIAGYFITGKLLWTSWVTGFISPSLGAIIGRSRRNYLIIKGLYNFDKRTTELKETIQRCRQELGIKTAQSA